MTHPSRFAGPSFGTAAVATALAAAVLAGCAPQPGRGPAAPPAVSASGSPSKPPSGALPGPGRAQVDAAVAAHARASGAPPDERGLSLARELGGFSAYLWETPDGRKCFTQVSVLTPVETACATGRGVPEESGSRLSKLFSTGMGNAEPYAILAAEPGARIVSVAYDGKELVWRHVRTLGPRFGGQDVYYVTLPEQYAGQLDVLLEQPDGTRLQDGVRI